MNSANIQSLVVEFPTTVRTNEYWTRKYPEIAQKQRAWLARRDAGAQTTGIQSGDSTPANDRFLFDACMAPYEGDPFLGGVERRCLEPGQTTVGIAVRAARRALDAAKLPHEEIDLLISCSMFPDRVGIGDAGFIARELDSDGSAFKGGAFNVSAACAGSLAGLLTASAFVQSGQARNVLLVAATNFSRAIEDSQTASRLTGDGAGALVLSRGEAGFGLLGAKSIHSGHTCGAWQVDTAPDPTGSSTGGRKIRLGFPPAAMQAIRSTGGRFLRDCVAGALEAANVHMDEVKLFVFQTSFAWNVDYCARVLGIDPERTINTYPSYGNVGPVSMLVNLHHAAATGRLSPGDLVVLYLFGGQSQASAAVMRWGEPVVGPMPSGIRDES